MARELSWGSVVLNILAAPTVYLIFTNFGGILFIGYECGATFAILPPAALYALIFTAAFLYGVIYDSTPMRAVKALALGVGSVLATFGLYSAVAQYGAVQYAVWFLGTIFARVQEAALVAFLTFAAWLIATLLAFTAAGGLTGGILTGAMAAMMVSAGIAVAMVGVAIYDIFIGRVWQQAVFSLAQLVSRALGVGMITPFVVWLGVVANTVMFLPVYALTIAFSVAIVALILYLLANPLTAIGGLIGAALAGVILGGLSNQLSAMVTALGLRMSTPVLATGAAGMALGILLAVGLGYLVSVFYYVTALFPIAIATAVLLLVVSPNLRRTVPALAAVFTFLIFIQFLAATLSVFARPGDAPVLAACVLDTVGRGEFSILAIQACKLCGGPPINDAEAYADYRACVYETVTNATYRGQLCAAIAAQTMAGLLWGNSTAAR